MEFTAPPAHILSDSETLSMVDPEKGAAFLKNPDRYRTKSPMLCAFMDELEKDGFVYNAAALRAFEKAHGLPPSGENGSALSTLVYTSQTYRRHDQLVRGGWTAGSQEMLKQAHEQGMGIVVIGENMLGGTTCGVLKVREIEGKFYAMRPKKRKFAVNIAGKPCKIAPLNTKAPEPRFPNIVVHCN